MGDMYMRAINTELYVCPDTPISFSVHLANLLSELEDRIEELEKKLDE